MESHGHGPVTPDVGWLESPSETSPPFPFRGLPEGLSQPRASSLLATMDGCQEGVGDSSGGWKMLGDTCSPDTIVHRPQSRAGGFWGTSLRAAGGWGEVLLRTWCSEGPGLADGGRPRAVGTHGKTLGQLRPTCSGPGCQSCESPGCGSLSS